MPGRARGRRRDQAALNQATVLVLFAALQPLFTTQEVRALPCGWHVTTSDTSSTDERSTVRLDDKVLDVHIKGSEGPRTAFLIVDGQEVRIDAVGPIEIRRFVSRHRRHKVVFGTIIHDRIWYAQAVCLRS